MPGNTRELTTMRDISRRVNVLDSFGNFNDAKETARSINHELPSFKEFILHLSDTFNLENAKGSRYFLRDESGFDPELCRAIRNGGFGRILCKVNWGEGTINLINNKQEWDSLSTMEKIWVQTGEDPLMVTVYPSGTISLSAHNTMVRICKVATVGLELLGTASVESALRH